MKTIDYSLYLVTNSDRFETGAFLAAVETAVQNGVTLVQLREKEKSGGEFYELACRVKEITSRHDVPLIIDDRVDIALAVDAEGIHVGQSDLPAAVVRGLVGPDKIVGVSAKTVEQALEAQAAGASYLGTGAMFPTTTKVVTHQTERSTLKAICEAVSIPVVAIGGIHGGNIHELAHCGVSGIAVVSAILKSGDIARSSQSLRKLTEEIKGF